VQDAVKVHLFVAELFPKSAAAHAATGVAFEAAGDRLNARSAYGRALALDSVEPRALERSRHLK